MNKLFDRGASIFFLLFGLLFTYESQKISTATYGSNVGPNVFPFVLGIILMLISLRLLYETFQYKEEGSEKQVYDYKGFFIIFFTAGLYVFFLEKIGYVICTFLFLLLSFQVMEKGKWIMSTIIALCFSIGTFYVYVNVLKGSLPSPDWLPL
jgi:putative tricarboxylic transport membrane protein